MAKTVIGLFDNRAEAQSVVRELLGEGLRHDDISVMSKKIEGQDDRQGETVAYVEEDGDEQIKDMAKGAGTGAAIGGLAGTFREWVRASRAVTRPWNTWSKFSGW